jgi:CrcB protein
MEFPATACERADDSYRARPAVEIFSKPPLGGFFDIRSCRHDHESGPERVFAQRQAMQNYFWIAVGSALGGMARYWCSGMAARLLGETFPWGTLFVNIAGSFVIGFFATMTGPDGRILVGSTARLFVMIGFCGGYTTFSSLSLQTLNLMHDGEWIYAGLNIAASVVLCLLAVWIGHVAAAALGALKWV